MSVRSAAVVGGKLSVGKDNPVVAPEDRLLAGCQSRKPDAAIRLSCCHMPNAGVPVSALVCTSGRLCGSAFSVGQCAASWPSTFLLGVRHPLNACPCSTGSTIETIPEGPEDRSILSRSSRRVVWMRSLRNSSDRDGPVPVIASLSRTRRPETLNGNRSCTFPRTHPVPTFVLESVPDRNPGGSIYL